MKARVMLVLLGLSLFFGGCAKPPDAELSKARSAFSEIEEDKEDLSQEQWWEIQKAMVAIDKEVESQGNKFALFRSYTRTKELLREFDETSEAVEAGTVFSTQGQGGSTELECQCTCFPKK